MNHHHNFLRQNAAFRLTSLATLLLLSLLALAACGGGDKGPAVDAAEGKIFVRSVLESAGTRWDVSDVLDRFDPRIREQEQDLRGVFKKYMEALGPLKTIKKIKLENARTPSGSRSFIGEYSCALECQKEKGTAYLVAYKGNSKWYVTTMTIQSPAIIKICKTGQQVALKEASRMTMELCSNWSFKWLKDHADKVLGAQLNSREGAEKARSLLGTGQKSVGPGLRVTSQKEGAVGIHNGEYVYNCIIGVKCAKGKLDITLSMVKEDGTWKIQGFRYEARADTKE